MGQRPGENPVLITIDTNTGAGTEVGSALTRFTASDMSFRESDGMLFAFLVGRRALSTVDLATGVATEVGTDFDAGSGNGIAFSPTGTLYHADDINLDTLDPNTAELTTLVALSFSPPADNFPRINAMDFDPKSGILFASLNDGFGGENENYLASVNLTTGVVTIIGRTVDGLDALAFVPMAAPSNHPPMLAAIGDLTLDEGTSLNVNVSASDPDNDPLMLSVSGLPPFAGFTDNHDGTGILQLVPGFDDAGVYASMRVTATDTAGNTASETIQVTVINAPVSIDAVDNQTSQEGATVTFTTAFSDAGTVDTHTAVVDWGDGITEPATLVESNGTGTVSGAHVYVDDGQSTVTVTITDNLGASSNTSFAVDVHNTAPVVLTATALLGNEGEVLPFAGTFSDAGINDTFTATVFWSDGTQTPGTVTAANGLGTVTADHIFADNGVYPVRLVVTDNAGDAGERVMDAAIANVPPVVTAADDQSIKAHQPLSLDVALFSDPGFTFGSTAETFTATIDWGDKTPTIPGSVSVTPGSAGTATRGTVSGEHTYIQDGDYTVTVTVTDDDGEWGMTQFMVQVIPDTLPSVTTTLLNDTFPTGDAAYGSDGITNDPRVTGTATDDVGITALAVQVDAGPFTDITASLSGDQYTFDPGVLAAGCTRSPSAPWTRSGRPAMRC